MIPVECEVASFDGRNLVEPEHTREHKKYDHPQSPINERETCRKERVYQPQMFDSHWVFPIEISRAFPFGSF